MPRGPWPSVLFTGLALSERCALGLLEIDDVLRCARQGQDAGRLASASCESARENSLPLLLHRWCREVSFKVSCWARASTRISLRCPSVCPLALRNLGLRSGFSEMNHSCYASFSARCPAVTLHEAGDGLDWPASSPGLKVPSQCGGRFTVPHAPPRRVHARILADKCRKRHWSMSSSTRAASRAPGIGGCSDLVVSGTAWHLSHLWPRLPAPVV